MPFIPLSSLTLLAVSAGSQGVNMIYRFLWGGMPAVEFVYAGGSGILSSGLVFSVGWWGPGPPILPGDAAPASRLRHD